MRARRAALLLAVIGVVAPRAEATVEMQVAAKKLGYPVGNCLYCHAHSHSVEVMKEKAKALGVSDGNCLACHGANIPAKLNERGHWLRGGEDSARREGLRHGVAARLQGAGARERQAGRQDAAAPLKRRRRWL